MGGAKNCPETPRQKMIGMMYLVLTAMLALNVSTDVLNGFRLVDESLKSSVKATENRNKEMMRLFEMATALNPEKNQEWYDKALELTAKSDSLYDYIHDFKYGIVKMSDGDDANPELDTIKNASNLDAAGQYALNQGNGRVLKEKIQAYKEYLIGLSNSTHADEFEVLFATNSGKTTDGTSIAWENALFDNMPVGASITLLTKIQNDIRTAESEMIIYLQHSTDASDMRVNQMEALVIPESKNVISGDKYKAQIVLVAVDTTQQPAYYVKGARINDNGIYEITTNATGEFTYQGELRVMGSDGVEQSYPFQSKYYVSAPMATISNQDLNVMYRGYDHKFSISVPGIAANQISVAAKGGADITRSGNMWNIKPSSKAEKVELIVSADVNGTVRQMGRQEYRILPLPDPFASVKVGDSEYSAKIWKSELTKPTATVVAGYGEDALISLDYTVISFTMKAKGRVTESKSNKFTAEQQTQLSRLKSGDDILIANIKVKTKTGQTKELERGVYLTLN